MIVNVAEQGLHEVLRLAAAGADEYPVAGTDLVEDEALLFHELFRPLLPDVAFQIGSHPSLHMVEALVSFARSLKSDYSHSYQAIKDIMTLKTLLSSCLMP